MNRYIKISALFLGFLVLAGALIFFLKSAHPLEVTNALAAEIEMVPTASDTAGVDLTSRFVIKSPEKIDGDLIEKNLSVQPGVKFSVREDNKEVLVIPEEPLAPNQIYQFTLHLADEIPLRWAFQTKGDFKINSTLPRDKSTGIPTNTGIEITFSHANLENPDQYIQITPKIEGRFEIHKKTVVFVPEKLEPGTVYSVRVKSGLKLAGSTETLKDDYVFQFETQDPGQHQNVKPTLELYNNTMDFTTGQIPLIPVGYYNNRQDILPKIQIDVYQYGDGAEYIQRLQEREKVPYWAYYSRRQYQEDTNGLTRIANFNLELKRYGYETFLEFPQPLKAGCYLADLSLENQHRQLWFQVSDLGVYTAVAENQTLVWVNDLKTGMPAAEAQVVPGNEGKPVTTDEKGLASLKTPEEMEQGVYFIVSRGNQETVAAVLPEFYGFGEQSGRDKLARSYWKYLYLDRSLYKPDDVVNFWGVMKPREKDGSLPDRVMVEITKWNGWDNNVVFETQEVALDGFSFTGNIKLPNLVPGYYNLAVKIEDQEIMQQGFAVETYVKPSFKLEIEADKKAVLVGDKVNFTIAAACFEDTPVPNVTLDYSLENNGKVTTDAAGKAYITYNPVYHSGSYGPFLYRYLYLRTSLPESGEITAGTTVMVLNNDISVKGSGEIIQGKGKVEFQLQKLSVDKVNRGEIDSWCQGAFEAGPAAHHPVTAEVFRREWEKIPDGDYYDFINKKVEKRYRYKEKRIFLTKIDTSTDQQGKGLCEFAAEADQSYWVKLSTNDDQGNNASTEVYLFGTGSLSPQEYSWYYLESGKQGEKYKPGDKVGFTFKNNENVVPDRENGFLFMVNRDGIKESLVQNSGRFEKVFPEDWVPNFWVRGVYFDGRFYHETYDCLASFDEQEKALQVTVQTDKEEYRPQDTVQVTVEVRDAAGKPAATQVNLNLVDEALYALRQQEVHFLESLYQDYLGSGIIRTMSTHKDPTNSLGGGAEKGGEGGAERRDFKDAVFFQTISTDRSGKEEVSFKVPDNLTSWRLTYQAVTDDLQAASGNVQVKVRLPFFINAVLNNTYLAGDQPVITIRSLGTKLAEKSTVSYQAELTGPGDGYQIEKEGRAFEPVLIPLPELQEGSYELTVRASAEGGLSDMLTVAFDVKSTLMSQEKTDFYLLSPETKIIGAGDSPTTVVLSDFQRSQYLHLLWGMQWLDGNRVEQKICAQIAGDLLQEYFPEQNLQGGSASTDFSTYQTPGGGIAILPYSDADLEVSAKIAAAAGDKFDRTALAAYFEQIFNDPGESRERGIISLYGLAALGEPVLQEIALLGDKDNLNVKESLYLILAQMELGDEHPAREKLKQLLENYGEETGPYLRINTGADQDDILEATALAAVAAGRINLDEQNKLQEYVMDNHAQDIVLYLEQVMFLKEVLPRLPEEPVSFSYHLNGEDKKVELAPGKDLTLMLTPEKLSTLSFSQIRGQVGVTVRYQDEFIPPDLADEDRISITRKYEPFSNPAGELKAGDLVVVKISYTMREKSPSGVYQVIDYLPAGLKIVERPYDSQLEKKGLGWPIEINGQKAVFLVSRTGSFHYYARVINSGTFTAENAVIQHTKSGRIWGLTKRDRVVVQ